MTPSDTSLLIICAVVTSVDPGAGRVCLSHRELLGTWEQNAARLAAASGVAMRIDPGRVPRREGASLAAALGDGEDYELLFTVPPERAPELEKTWPDGFAPLTRIGEVMAGSGEVVAPDGADLLKDRVIGYEH